MDEQADISAFTLVEIIVVVGLIGILAAIALSGFHYYTKKAYNVTVYHDLRNFAKAEENYYFVWNSYVGKAGDYVKGGHPLVGTLPVDKLNYRPSDGVTIEIISGGEGNEQEPFVVRAYHEKGTKRYIYDFSSSQVREE